jgi:hypothetical protein
MKGNPHQKPAMNDEVNRGAVSFCRILALIFWDQQRGGVTIKSGPYSNPPPNPIGDRIAGALQTRQHAQVKS